MILCCGEALIDMVAAPSLDGPDGFVPHSGGAVFNTAIALGRLGARAGMLTGLSHDMFGDQLADGFVASGGDGADPRRGFEAPQQGFDARRLPGRSAGVWRKLCPGDAR